METVSESIHLWSKVINNLESKIDDRRIFDAFLSDSKIFSFEGNKMVVAVTSSLAATLLTNKYLDVIQSSVREITGQRVDIKFENAENLKSTPKEVEEQPKYFRYSTVNDSLNFDNVITGPCNIEAKQAAILIAKYPGSRDYNPLFIYSESGLGKTHLLYLRV